MELVLRSRTGRTLFVLLSLLALPAARATVVSTADNEISIDLPDGWSTMPRSSSDIQLEASNPVRRAYLLLSAERTADIDASLKEYADRACDALAVRLINPQKSQGKKITVNGCNGYQYEVLGTLSTTRLKVAYLLTIFQGKSHLINVTGSTTESRFTSCLPELLDLPQRVTEAPEPASQP
jgi:hypothetical protein